LVKESIESQDSKVKFKDKMVKLKSIDEDAITCSPGEIIHMKWVIKNESKQHWPRFPILRNVTTSAKTLQYISVDSTPELLVRTKLAPGADFELHY
jgi:hypothetical protein